METQNSNSVTDTQHQSLSPTVSVGDWVITLILMIIPLVNLVMLFVWAFGGSAAISKANWAKATLIMYLIAIILCIVLSGVIGALLSSVMRF